MADRLGQEKDNKRSKTLLTVAVVLVVLNVLLFFLVPTQKTISYDEDAVIYSVSDERYEKPCHVTLTGTLTQSVLLKDVFEGSLYITDVPGLEDNMTIRLTRQNGAWAIFTTGRGRSSQPASGMWRRRRILSTSPSPLPQRM